MKFLGVLVAIAVLLAVAIHFLPVDTIIAERAASRSGYEAGEEYTDLEYRYYYNQLTENEKTAYHIICAQLTDFPGQILVPNLNTEELDAVFRAISYDNPEFFFLGNECKIYNVGGLFGSVTSLFLPEYTMTQEEYEAALTEVEDAAAQILSSAPSSSSAYTQELYLHDTLVQTTEYDDSEDTSVFTLYGVLINHSANCEGYARTMQYLLKQQGVVNRVITGQADDGSGDTVGHMWNVVTLNEEEYNLDVTWDDYSVAGVENYSDKEVSHMYFNVPSSYLKSTHSVEDESLWDQCTSTRLNYFTVNGTDFTLYNREARTAMAKAYARALNAGFTSVEFHFQSDSAYQTAKASLFTKGDIYSVIDGANALAGDNRVSANRIQYAGDDQKHIIRLFGVKN